MDEASMMQGAQSMMQGMQGAQGMLVQNWPTVSSAAGESKPVTQEPPRGRHPRTAPAEATRDRPGGGIVESP